MAQDRLLNALNRLSQALIRLEEADHRRMADQDIAARYQKLREATEEALSRIDCLLTGNIQGQDQNKTSFPTKEDRAILANSLADSDKPQPDLKQKTAETSPSQKNTEEKEDKVK
ncbi:MAG: hypothetical protein ABF760_08190 [Zymomonas mobilis]|nr:hypothetical protein [Zymomonas mobilis]